VVLVIVATGNHFLFDAAAGALVVVIAYPLAAAISRAGATDAPERPEAAAQVHRLPTNVRDVQTAEEQPAA